MSAMVEDAGPCPCCGSLLQSGQRAALLAVCDVLVVKSLEAMGKRIVRAERSRFKARGDRPFHEVHLLWQPSEETVDKALKGAWDVIPPLLATHHSDLPATAVTQMLDEYVHDLAITGTAHNIEDLMYRLRDRLDMPVWTHPAAPTDRHHTETVQTPKNTEHPVETSHAR